MKSKMIYKQLKKKLNKQNKIFDESTYSYVFKYFDKTFLSVWKIFQENI